MVLDDQLIGLVIGRDQANGDQVIAAKLFEFADAVVANWPAG